MSPGVPELFDNDPAVVVTHAHLDHQGGAHEFDACWAHPDERVASPLPQPLDLAGVAAVLGIPLDGEPLTEWLVGHGDPFGPGRLAEIAEGYLRSRGPDEPRV